MSEFLTCSDTRLIKFRIFKYGIAILDQRKSFMRCVCSLIFQLSTVYENDQARGRVARTYSNCFVLHEIFYITNSKFCHFRLFLTEIHLRLSFFNHLFTSITVASIFIMEKYSATKYFIDLNIPWLYSFSKSESSDIFHLRHL